MILNYTETYLFNQIFYYIFRIYLNFQLHVEIDIQFQHVTIKMISF